jgi:hypothetical protein
VLLAIAAGVVVGALALLGLGVLIYAAWINGAKWLGRFLAQRDTLALTDREIAATSRPWVEPLEVLPAPRNGSSAGYEDAPA